MGELIGMILAAQPNSPIRRLVINDAGPFVPKAAPQRLLAYVGLAPSFPQVADAEQYLRKVLAPFGAKGTVLKEAAHFVADRKS